MEAELNNTVRMYQQFCDRNIELKKREDELLLSISELGARESELRKATTGLEQQLSELWEYDAYNDNLNLEFKQEKVISTNDVLIPPPNMAINYHQNEDKALSLPVNKQSYGCPAL